MNDKLRECPFCGSKPDTWTEFDIDRVGCSNDQCIAQCWPQGVSPVTWNTRNQPPHETVEQWEERTGQTYPYDGPVWIYKEFKHNANMPDDTGWDNEIWKYKNAKCGLAFYIITKIIVANHHGKPEAENG